MQVDTTGHSSTALQLVAKQVFTEQTICVKGVHPSVDENQLNQMLEPFGRILFSRLCCFEGNFYRIGFVNFASAESATKAIQAYQLVRTGFTVVKYEPREPIDTILIKSPIGLIKALESLTKEIYLQKSTNSPLTQEIKPHETPTPIGTRLHVENLGQYNTEDKLRQLFAAFGDITDVKILADKRKESANVWFADPKEADNACVVLSGMPVGTKEEMIVQRVYHEYATT